MSRLPYLASLLLLVLLVFTPAANARVVRRVESRVVVKQAPLVRKRVAKRKVSRCRCARHQRSKR